ncbi:MAG: tRNA (adenosine(37)-N6)-threonylcarbamoyltransferase complex dimerization subunit type 1 TsaB [Pseudomonadota bacterium]|nr:tRNA (adenosine(37)-N6)-threonylcarbamoyltransferase complex dimerization subunit type 1 TsaB [Pseudomonadota bacterium]
MNILALETTTHKSSLALQVAERRFVSEGPGGRGQTQWLLPAIDQLLAEHGLTLAELDALAYSQGPGSFTGLRAGVSVLQAFSYVHELPVFGFSSLLAYAHQAAVQERFSTDALMDVWVCVDAKMGEVFFAHYQYQNGQFTAQQDDGLLSPEQTAHWVQTQRSEREDGEEKLPLLIGDGWLLPELTHAQQVGRWIDCTPGAEVLLSLAQQCLDSGEPCQRAEQVSPVYLRGKDAWKTIDQQGR